MARFLVLTVYEKDGAAVASVVLSNGKEHVVRGDKLSTVLKEIGQYAWRQEIEME